MTRHEVSEINRTRLARWAGHLGRRFATAVILIGVPHDDLASEPVVLLTLEDGPTPAELAEFLRWAADQIEAQQTGPQESTS